MNTFLVALLLVPGLAFAQMSSKVPKLQDRIHQIQKNTAATAEDAAKAVQTQVAGEPPVVEAPKPVEFKKVKPAPKKLPAKALHRK